MRRPPRPTGPPTSRRTRTRKGAKDPAGDPLEALHRVPYGPAIDAQGNADCQTGQRGYLDGPLVDRQPLPALGRTRRRAAAATSCSTATSRARRAHFKGVPNLKDVP